MTSKDGRTALMVAADNNRLNIVQYLVQLGEADANLADGHGNTAIMLAAAKGHTLVVEYLARIGSDLQKKNELGQTVYEIQPVDGNTHAGKHRARIETAINRGLEAANSKEAPTVDFSKIVIPSPRSAKDKKAPPAELPEFKGQTEAKTN